MVRMQDVADRAQVSIATVSFVVNGTKQVAPATRARVEDAMSELGFTRNVLARALATKRSRLIALLYPALAERLNANAAQFVHAAAAAAAERDHHLVIWPVENDPVGLREYLDGGLVDGVLAMEVQLEDPRVQVFEEARMPYVLIGRTNDPSGYSFADVDFETSTTAAIRHLRDLGHEAITLMLEEPLVLGESAYGPSFRTERTYRELMAEAGATASVVYCGRRPKASAEAVDAILAVEPRPTAVLVMNDEAAPGLVRDLQAAGVGVPGDMSVLGLCMSPTAAAYCSPELDFYAAPGASIGRAAAMALIDRIEAPGARPRADAHRLQLRGGGVAGVRLTRGTGDESSSRRAPS